MNDRMKGINSKLMNELILESITKRVINECRMMIDELYERCLLNINFSYNK